MAGFAGFDISGFPKQPVMDWRRANTDLVWCGFYRGPAPGHGDTSWMGGWGTAPVFVGQPLSGAHSSHIVTGPQGTTDGGDAAKRTAQAGFPPGSCVFLDLEDGPPLNAPRTDYAAAWVTAVKAGRYRPGIYGSHAIAANVQALHGNVPIPAFKVPTTDQTDFSSMQFPDPPPAGCGYPAAAAWQLQQWQLQQWRLQQWRLQQTCQFDLPGASVTNPVVDLDSAMTPGPGAPPATSV